METYQVLISLAVFILIFFFVVLSVQLFFILKELRLALGKANHILDHVEDVTKNVADSVDYVENFVSQTASIFKVVDFIRKRFVKK